MKISKNYLCKSVVIIAVANSVKRLVGSLLAPEYLNGRTKTHFRYIFCKIDRDESAPLV